MQIPSNQIANVANPVSGVSAPALKTGGPSFVRTLTEAVAQVNEMQLQSADSGRGLGLGSAQSLHKVVLEAEEASLSMQLVVSLRNKAIETG